MGFRIACPNCGERSYTEFWFGGEVPSPEDDDFARAWLRRNAAGGQLERWFHAGGCRRWLTLERGQVLITEGEPGDAYYVLESGSRVVSQGGRELRVSDSRGDGVGEIALLRDVPRTATVAGREVAVLLKIGRAEFLEVVAGHAPAHDAAQQVIASRSDVAPAG